MMSRKIKTTALITAIMFIISLFSFSVYAADFSKFEAVGAEVTLDGTNPGIAKVYWISNDEQQIFNWEGFWSLTDLEGKNKLSLTELTSEIVALTGFNFADVDSGKTVWQDSTLSNPLSLTNGSKILTATYTVAADAPEGIYTVEYRSDVLTGADYNPDTTVKHYTAEINVKRAGTPPTPVLTPIAVPTAITGLVYTGSEQQGVPNGTGYTLTGHKATNAGDSYTATATLESGYKWDDDSTAPKTITWSIAKADDPSYTVPTGLSGMQGSALSTVVLPAGWAWKTPTTVMNTLGNHTFKAKYTPSNTNYKTVDNVDVAVTVTAAPCSHGTKTTVAEKASTCKDKGWDAYQVCECGQMFDMSDNPISEIPYRALAAHNYTAETKNTETLKTAGTCKDEAVYYYSCAVCGRVENNDSHTFTGDKNPANHVGGTTIEGALEADHNTQTPGYSGDRKCLGCGVVLETGHAVSPTPHVPSAWTGDDAHHWKTCTVPGCGVEIDGSRAAHGATGANAATCQHKAICDICGSEYGTLAEHNKAAEWSADASGHWHACRTTGCTEQFDFAAHTPNREAPTETESVECTECHFIIAPATLLTPIPVPTAVTGLVYTGSEQQGVLDGTGYTLTGHRATDAGIIYTATATLESGYKWDDDSTAPKTITWSIAKADDPSYAVPTGLNGLQGSVLSTVALPAGWEWIDGTIVMDAAGDHTFKAKYTPSNANYNTVDDVDITVTVSGTTPVLTPIAVPTAVTGLVYTGSEQQGVLDGTGYTLTGHRATDAGIIYTATATLESGYKWDDESTAPKTITWSIAKAVPTGTPIYTAITAANKTLADAALTTTGADFSVPGTVKWIADDGSDLADTTVVTANTYYKWQFNPTDAVNYETITGMIRPYRKSTGGGGSSSGTSRYTISFETNGGSKLTSKTVTKNTVLEEPTAPTKENFDFAGWYTDKELKTKYDFSEKVTKSFTLYAKWAEKDNSINQIILTIGKKDAKVFGKTKTNDVAPKIVNDRTMLPARFVAENLGAKVEWDGEKELVTITGKNEKNENVTILITIGAAGAVVNGKEVTLDSAAFVENDRTYTPIRFISELLGAKVDWDGENQIVTITKAAESK